MKIAIKLFYVLVALLLASCSDESSVTLKGLTVSWVAPSQREDNSALALSEISGYNIYYGVEKGVYLSKVEINDQTVTDSAISDLIPDTYYLVITTVDDQGRESAFSDEVNISL